MFNKVLLIGILGGSPTVHYTENGAMATFSLATTEKRGENKFTEQHEIVVFGALADAAKRILKPGSKVYIEGQLRTRMRIGQDGSMKGVPSIVARKFQLFN